MTPGWGVLLSAGLATVVFVGCSPKKLLYADPAAPSGFIEDPDKMAVDETKPFQRDWIAPGFRNTDYNEILVAPVDISHVESMSWWQKASLDPAVEGGSLGELAAYFNEAVKKAFRESKHNRFAVVETPGPSTLLLELALVEVVPTKAWLNTIGWASAAVGGPASISHGSTAMEGRLRDGTGGDPIALFADREYGKMSVISVADLQWHAHTRHTIDRWAAQFVEIVNKPIEARTKDSIPFTLKPW